ncbi:GNAT family N-acetyltransferase [Clostridium sp. AWRP]|uniref:GNAT family N-acetyltransferase n=1 Tax=Clostridium sp. AWRP TaxID=2212991 RepID=UPI000FDAE59F|nr:GNAT family N-acetyltransferase [Clostridium sp. AWRP]
MKVVCIVQARFSSTRLPGKVLKEICGKTVLEHDVDRLRRIKNLDEIVIATTTLEKDNAIVKECEKLKVKCFRGSEEDVLSRYYYAAKENSADVVVRVTSDCPLIDSEVAESIIQCYMENREKYDYVSNTIDRTYPRGLDTEVFSFYALEKAFNEAASQRDREHVTPYIWDNDNIFNIFQYKNEMDYSNLRWTLDTKEDFKLISIIYEQFQGRDYFGMNEIVKFLEKNPEVKEINKCIEQKKIDDSLFLIPAGEGHCDLIYEWVNEDEVRKNSFDDNEIPYDQHVNWYFKKLKDPDCFIYLLADSNKNIGIVRIEKKGNENVVSYSISKQFRGKGYGYKILEKLQDKLMKENKNIVLTGYVKKENIYSVKIFEKLHYDLVENDDYNMKFEKNLSR